MARVVDIMARCPEQKVENSASNGANRCMKMNLINTYLPTLKVAHIVTARKGLRLS